MINQPPEKDSGGICGVVTDFATGEPIKNANVQLRPTGETTLTGTEGYYEFQNIKEGDYSITVSKLEYTDLIDDYVITVVPNRVIRRDVQIKKEPTADKGALLTTFLSLSGKYVAYMPYGSPYGAVSRKIENTQEKNRLLQIANELASSENVRLIIRTEALGKSKEVIYQDLMQLKEKFLKIQQQAQQVVVPSLLYQGESSFIKKIVQGIRKFFRKK